MLNTSHKLFQLHSNYQTFWGPNFQKFMFRCVYWGGGDDPWILGEL